jgi:DNA polymerase elongation subunit (family B)
MMIEISQSFRGIDISYIDKDGFKALMTLPPPPGGFANWEIAPEGQGVPGYQHFNGAPVHKVRSKQLNRFDLLAYLFEQPKEVQAELFAYRKANLITIDIETAIGDRFPDPSRADQEVLLITCIDQNFNVIIYTTKPNVDEVIEQVKEIVIKHIGHLIPPHIKIVDNFRLFQYDSEAVMLSQFMANIVARAAIISFWNGDGFDWPYLMQRCLVVGVDSSLSSMTREISSWDNKPKHTIVNDYMKTTDEYAATIKNKESLSLDYMSHRVLNVGKLPKVASLKEMAELDEYLAEFVAYNVVDTLNMQLIHIKLNLLDVLYAFGDLNHLPIDKTESQVAQLESIVALEVLQHLNSERPEGSPIIVAAEAKLRPDMPLLVDQVFNHPKFQILPEHKTVLHFKGNKTAYYQPWPHKPNAVFAITIDDLVNQGMDYATDMFKQHTKIYKHFRPIFPIAGGHVKDPDPVRPLRRWLACIDFSGQYPACHRSFNISVDNILGNIDEFEPEQQMDLVNNPDIFVSFDGNVYDVSRDGIYKRCQIRLRNMRDVHKGEMLYHFNIQQPYIEYELHRRGLWWTQPVLPDAEALAEYSHKIVDSKMMHEGIDLFTLEAQDLDIGMLWHLFHTNLGAGHYNNNMQIAYKLESNSLYGATANSANKFGDSRVASDTTSAGRNTITCAEQIVNNYAAFEWHTDETAHKLLWETFGPECFDWPEDSLEHYENLDMMKPKGQYVPNFGNLVQVPYDDRVAYIDTDSLYVAYEDLFKSIGFTGDKIEFFVTLYTKHLGKIVNSRLADMINGHGGTSMIKFDLELICTHAIFTMKKKYILAVGYSDGRRYKDSVQNITVKGMDMKQNALSPQCKWLVEQMLHKLLRDEITDKAGYIEYMVDAWEQFKSMPLEEIAKRQNIKKDAYEDKVLKCSYADNEVLFASRTLPQYRGAAFFNYHLEKHGLMGEIEPLMDGTVLVYEDVNGNPFAFRLMEELPFEKPEPNRLLMFYKLVVMAIDRFAYAFNVVTPLKDYLDLGVDIDITDDIDTEE